jgi:hypothetical protein
MTSNITAALDIRRPIRTVCNQPAETGGWRGDVPRS